MFISFEGRRSFEVFFFSFAIMRFEDRFINSSKRLFFMDKDFLGGIKFGAGASVVLFLVFSVVYAVGFHHTNEIVPGVFQGNFSFNGSVEADNIAYSSTTDNLSDIKSWSDEIVSSSTSKRVLVNVTGEGNLLGGQIIGYFYSPSSSSSTWGTINITVDGNSFRYPKVGGKTGRYKTSGSTSNSVILPPIHYDNSLKVSYYYEGSGRKVIGHALTKDSK